MSSPRVSDESDLSEGDVFLDEFDESDSVVEDETPDERPLKPAEMLLFESSQLTAADKLMFSMTSRKNYVMAVTWVAFNIPILNFSDNSRLVMLLCNAIAASDERAKMIAGKALTDIGILSGKPFNEQVVRRLISVIKHSGYENHVVERDFCSVVLFYQNENMVRLLLENDFLIAELRNQIRNAFLMHCKKVGDAMRKPFAAFQKMMLEHDLKKVMQEIRDGIMKAPFTIHNYGGEARDEIGHRVPKHAARIFDILNEALKSDVTMIDGYREIVSKVREELKDIEESSENSSQQQGWFGGYSIFNGQIPSLGVRDSSTNEFYKSILQKLTQGLDALNEYQQLMSPTIEQRHDCGLPKLAANPTMSQ